MRLLNIFGEQLYQMWWQGIIETIDDNVCRNLYNVVYHQIEMIGPPLRPLMQQLWAGERDLPTLAKDLDDLDRRMVEVVLDLLAESRRKTIVNRIPVLKTIPDYAFVFKYLMRMQTALLEADLSKEEMNKRMSVLKKDMRRKY